MTIKEGPDAKSCVSYNCEENDETVTQQCSCVQESISTMLPISIPTESSISHDALPLPSYPPPRPSMAKDFHQQQRPCLCWRGGLYCLPSELSSYLRRSSLPDMQSIPHSVNLSSPSSLSPRYLSSTDVDFLPPQVKHLQVIQELRDGIRELWTTSTLSEMIPENSKIVVVDSRLPLHVVIRSLIEYKRSFVVIFCEETGQIVGEFSFHDIVEFLLHFWKCLTDPLYTDHIGNILCDYVAPQFRAELILQASQFSESTFLDRRSHLSSMLAAPRFDGVDTTAASVGLPSNTENSELAGASLAENFTQQQTLFDSSPMYAHDTHTTTTNAPDSHLPQTPYSSSWSPTGDFLSNGKLTDQSAVPSLFGSNQTVSDRLFLAVFLSHHHRDVLLPLPSWFSVRLFEDSSFTPKRFRKLRKIMNRKMKEEDRNSLISQTRHKSNQTEKSPNDFYMSNSMDDNPSEQLGSLPMGHLVPPPWTYSLDLWKRLCGFAGRSSLLSINPNRSPLEATFLLVREKLSQIVVWNDDRSSPLHFLSPYSMLSYVIQHLRGQHSALDLFIRGDLGLGTRGDLIVSVDPDDSFYYVLEVFRNYKFSSLPVVERSTGRLKGFLNRSHVLALVAKVLQTPSAISLQESSYKNASHIEETSANNPNINSRNSEFINLTTSDGSEQSRGIEDNLAASLDLDESLNCIMERHMGFSYGTQISCHSYTTQSSLLHGNTPPASSSVPPGVSVSASHRVSPPQQSHLSSAYQSPISLPRHDGYQQPTIASPCFTPYPQEPCSPALPDASGYLPCNTDSLKRESQPFDTDRHRQQTDSSCSRGGPSTWYATAPDPSTPARSHLLQQSPGPYLHAKAPPIPERPSQSPSLPFITAGPSPTAIVLSSHGISYQTASPAILNALLLSPVVVDSDMTLRDCIGHILLTDEHKVALVDVNTLNIIVLISIGDILTFLVGYCCDCKGPS